MKPLKFAILLMFGASLAGCSSPSLHMYSPDEQAKMNSDGTLQTIITPSELRDTFKNAGKIPKPTGQITYCNAGLLSGAARSDALKSIDQACGGNGQYTILSARPLIDPIRTSFGANCTRSEAIIFRCNGVNLKQK
jgi:hypothetical protein